MRRLSLLISAIALLLGPAAPLRAQDYYAGKTMTILVGLAAGGSADTLVRSFVPYLKKHGDVILAKPRRKG